jgi:hypothetical protein
VEHPTERAGSPGSGRSSALRLANEALAFVIELVALGLLAYWGVWIGDGAVTRITLAIALPLAAAVLWGLFAAPRARFKVPLAAQLLVKAIVYGAATVALAVTGHPTWAVVFAVVAVVNTAAAARWRTRDGVPGMDR